jgi:hypothetical protein
MSSTTAAINLALKAIAGANPASSDLADRLAYALDQAGAAGVTEERLRGWRDATAALVELAALALQGRVEPFGAGWRWTAAEVERRRLEAEESARAAAERARRDKEARFARAREERAAAEQGRLAEAGPLRVAAVKAIFRSTAPGAFALLDAGYVLRDGILSLSCAECGAEGALDRLPGSLKHDPLCITRLDSPVYAADAR